MQTNSSNSGVIFPFKDLFDATGGPSGSISHDLTTQGQGFHGPDGVGGVLAGIAESLFGGGGGGANLGGGVGMLGDFDPFQYVESNLAKMQQGGGSSGGSGGGGLTEAIGGFARLLGLGG